jgi:hypothetical protein
MQPLQATYNSATPLLNSSYVQATTGSNIYGQQQATATTGNSSYEQQQEQYSTEGFAADRGPCQP